MTAAASGARSAADLKASPTEACASGWDVFLFQCEMPVCIAADLATILRSLEQSAVLVLFYYWVRNEVKQHECAGEKCAVLLAGRRPVCLGSASTIA